MGSKIYDDANEYDELAHELGDPNRIIHSSDIVKLPDGSSYFTAASYDPPTRYFLVQVLSDTKPKPWTVGRQFRLFCAYEAIPRMVAMLHQAYRDDWMSRQV